MDAQLYGALLSLGLLVIGSVGLIVKALTERVLSDLAKNTTITTQAKEAANGRLDAAQNALAKERDRVLALRALVRERDDRLAYIEARMPAVVDLMKAYGKRHQDQRTDSEENRVLESLLEDIDMQNGKH